MATRGRAGVVDGHDFPSDAVGKAIPAIPYGVYDIGANDGFVSVGVDHDTPVFVVTSIQARWKPIPRDPGVRSGDLLQLQAERFEARTVVDGESTFRLGFAIPIVGL